MPASKRSIWRGDAAELAAAIDPHAPCIRFCTYREDLHAPLDVSGLRRQQGLLKALQRLQPNLSFPKRLTEQALEILFQNKGWQLDDEQKQSWVNIMALRLRAMAHHISQSLMKKKVAKWLVDLDLAVGASASKEGEQSGMKSGDDEKGNGNEEGSDNEEGTIEPEPSYFYGFDWEHYQGYRVKVGTTHKDLSMKVFEAPDSEETDAIQACWSDGHISSIADVTVAELRSFQANILGFRGALMANDLL